MDTKKLRQKILDLAIRGKLVPQDPNDEPASVLLERIRAEKERLIAEGKIKRSKKAKTSSSESHYQNFEPPFEIPDSWEWAQVNDITSSILYGVSESAKSQGEYKLLRITDIQDNSVNWGNVPYTDFDKNKAAQYILKIGDIVFARTGATVGKSYLVESVPSNSIYASYLIRIRTNEEILPEYLKIFFESTYYWQQIFEGAVGIGQPNVNGTSLGLLWLPIPPRNEQRRIVSNTQDFTLIVTSMEHSKKAMNESITQIKSKLLEFAMQGKLVPQDASDEPAADMLRRINPKAKIITDNPHSWNVPNGWSIAKLKDIANLVTGSTPSKSNSEYYGNEYPFYKPQDLDKSIVSEASEYLSEMGFQASRNIPKNSIAICCIGTIGKVGFINRAGATNQQINTILPNPSFYPKFLYYYCKAKIFQDIILSLSAAITISIVNKGKMGEILILLPPLEEQKRIVAKIEELYSVLDKIEASLQS